MKYIYKYKNHILITLLLLFFKDFFLQYYQKYIVDTILVEFNKSISSDILILFIILFSCGWLFSKIKIRFYLKDDYIIYSLIFLLICGYIRYNYENELLETYFFSSIKYFDIYFLLGVIPLILMFAFWITNNVKENEESEFFNDIPADEDILNRKPKALQVTRLIKGNKSKTSLAIGIVGEWGDGKTTFMSFVEKSLSDDERYIIVHFNSWLNISVNSILNDFFTTVEKKISAHSIDISKEIKKYGNNVLSVNTNSTTETILNAIKIIPDNSLSDDFDNLNKLLNKLDKKVIVLFDDLDRLQPNEVFEVLKLIRNTASFDVFNYVVGYDKAYLNKALEKNNIPFPEKYCEKIFLKEFPLPPITQSQINTFLKDNILKWLPKKKDEIENVFEYANVFLSFNEQNMFKSINNLRNAKRFLNEFKISVEKVKDDIFLQDFILIKLLKFSYYEVYRLLFNKNTYIENNDNGFSGNSRYTHYRLRKKDNKSSFSPYNTFNDSSLKEDIVALKIFSDNDIKIIGTICQRIFDSSNRVNNINRNSIIYGHNYYRYFEDEISDSEITNAEFNTFMNGSFDDKKQIVDKVYSEDRLIGLLLFIYKVKIYEDINSKTKYEDFIKILFYIVNLKSVTQYLHYHGIDFDFLDDCMSNFQNVLIKRFKYRDENELKEFFKSLFYEKKKSYYFETDFVKYLLDRHGINENLNIPFNKREIEEYLIYCFDNDSKLITGIDDRFWHCYQLCFAKQYIQENANTWGSSQKIIKKNKEKFLNNIIPMYYIDFLLHCVIPQDWYGENDNSLQVGLPKDRPLQLFGSHENFISYLESDKFKEKIGQPYEFLDEFLEFAKEVARTKKFIDFNFTYPPVLEKLENAKSRWNKQLY